MTAGWRKGEGSVRAQVRHATDERGSPGPFGENPLGLYEQIDEVSRVDNSRTLASASGALPVGRAGRVLVLAAYNRLGSEFASPFGPSESNSNRWLGRAQLDVPVSSSFDVSAGLELQRERTGSSFITDMEGQEVQVKRRTAAYFAEARWTTSSSLFLTGGLRLDDIHRERFAETVDSDSVVSVNPRAAVAWFVRPGAANYTKLRGAVATGIRPPDGFELAFTDNPALKPERSFSTEAAIEQAFAGGRGRFEAVAFYNEYRRSDCHRWIFQDSSRFQTDNIANARARGIELGLTGRHRLNAPRAIDVHGRVAYTFMDTDILAVDGDDCATTVRGRRPAAAPSSASVVAGGRDVGGPPDRIRHRPRAWACPRRRAVIRRLRSPVFADGFNVWDAGAAWRLHRTVDVFGRIENIAGRGYEEALGFPALGRRATLGLRIAAGR